MTRILLPWLLLFSSSAGAQPPCDETLFEFEVEDQFQDERTHRDLLGTVSLIVWADRKATEWSGAWGSMLSDALEGQIAGGLVQVRGWAHTRGAPFFIKGRIRGKFPKEPASWAFLDWGGDFRERYEPEEDHVTVYVFDRQGCLVATEMGQEIDAAAIARLTRAAQDVLERDAGDDAPDGYSAPE